MSKLVAVLQVLAAVILAIIALATAINLILISTRPETISVVNTLVGQGVLIVIALALAQFLLRKGYSVLRAAPDSDSDSH